MFVKPADGLTIRDPDLGGYLPKDGREVPETEYWNRRLFDRDVVKAEPPAEEPTAEIAPASEADAPTE